MPNVILKIKSQYINFRERDKKIADFIINDQQKFIYLTISEVSEQLGVSDATVFRFCKKMGFDGFQAFKIALASDTNENSLTQNISKQNEDENSILHKVFASNISALEDTLKFVDIKKIKSATELLINARQIVFVGNGGSGIVALDAHHKFLRTGLANSAYTDSHMQLMAVSQLSHEDVLVVISHSGSNKNMLQVLDIAKEKGIKTIGITSFSKSPISKKVDILLSCISQETEHQFEAFASRIAHLSIIDALYINVMVHREEKSLKALQKMRSAISHTRL